MPKSSSIATLPFKSYQEGRARESALDVEGRTSAPLCPFLVQTEVSEVWPGGCSITGIRQKEAPHHIHQPQTYATMCCHREGTPCHQAGHGGTTVLRGVHVFEGFSFQALSWLFCHLQHPLQPLYNKRHLLTPSELSPHEL